MQLYYLDSRRLSERAKWQRILPRHRKGLPSESDRVWASIRLWALLLRG